MSHPIRVLHIVDSLGVGGIETWLVQILERMDRRRVAIDILVQRESLGVYEPRARAAGAAILRCSRPHRFFRYARRYRQLLREHGPYDVVHSHVYYWSGVLLALAHREGVSIRVAHSRSAVNLTHSLLHIPRVIAYQGLRHLVLGHMTHGLAVSAHAGRALFGRAWHDDPRCAVMPSGIDLSPFRHSAHGLSLRRELGIAEEAPVIGHIGRYLPVKNHRFLIEAFHALHRQSPEAVLALVGQGPLEDAVKAHVREFGLDACVRFFGYRDDVPRLMQGLFDVVALPSQWEGLPRVANEAQAAGLPIVISDHLAPEIDLVRPLVTRLPLDAGPEAWAKALLERAARPRPLTPGEAFEMMSRSPVNIERNVAELAELYRGARRF